MANESDCELVILKRPKTKLQITEDVSTKTNSDENNVLEDTTSFIDTKGKDELKKATKRSRESDEESSITSEDDIMSKKRVKKNSEELESFRPKKVLSVAVRKRREVARTIREKKISALDSDSENDSDSVCSDLEAQKVLAVSAKSDLHKKCDDNTTSIILSHVDDNIVANSCGVNVKKMYSKTDCKKLTRKHYKAHEKNEDSTSAYNSDSQDEVCKTKNVNSGETDMLQLENGPISIKSPKESLSFVHRKKLEKSNSESEFDEGGNDKPEVVPDTNINMKRVKCNEKKVLSTCDITNITSKQLGKTCSVDTSFSEKYPSCTTSSDKVDHREPQENLPLIKVDDVKFSNSSKSGKKVSCISSESNSEDNSSDETSEKKNNTSVLRETVDKNRDAKVKKYLKTSKSPSENSSGDEIPLKTTLSSSPKKGGMKVESKLKGTSSHSLHKDCHSDGNDQMVSKTLEKQEEEKVIRMKEVKICQDYSDYSSDSNRLLKKTKSSESSEVEIKSQLPTKTFVSAIVDSSSNDDDRPVDHTGYPAEAKQKVKSKIEKHFTNNPSSSQEENHSEGEQPLKKTKSSNKTRSISDDESSDDNLLKKKQKEKSLKSRVITKTSADNSDDGDDQHFENKQFVALKGDKANILKNRKSKSKQSVSCQRPEFCESDEETRISKSHKIKTQKSKNKGVESLYDVCPKGYGKSKTTFSEKDQNTSSEDESVSEKPIKKNQAVNKNKIARKEKDVENEKSENSSKNKKLPCNKKASSDSDNYRKSSKKSTVKRNQSSSDNSSDSDEPLRKTVSSLKKVARGISEQHVTLSFANKPKHTKRGRISRETLSKSKNSENSSASSCDASDYDEHHAKTPKSGTDSEESLVSKPCHEKLLKSSCFPSDSESENLKTRPIKMLKEKDSTLLKKDISDSESSCEKNSGNEDRKPDAIKSVKREDLSSDSSNSNKLLSSKVKHEISDSTDLSDSEGNKKESDIKKKMSKTCEGVSGKKPPISSSDSETDIESKSDMNKKKSKGPSKMEIRINNYKKYIRAAGIRVNTRINSPFWEGCKSDKQRCDRLAKCLEDHGVKGRPSIAKCKVVRKKLEKKREVEELDLSNIIEDDGNTSRYRCRRSRKDSCDNKSVVLEKKAVETASEIKQRFSRIKDLIDSDSSSN